MVIDNLLERLEDAIRSTEEELKDPVNHAEAYVAALRGFAEALEETPEEDIINAEIIDPDTNLRKTQSSDPGPGVLNKELQQGLLTDKKILPYVAKSEADALSLISTFVAFRLSRRRGLPNHSKIYMDWCEQLRQVVNAFFDVDTPDFC